MHMQREIIREFSPRPSVKMCQDPTRVLLGCMQVGVALLPARAAGGRAEFLPDAARRSERHGHRHGGECHRWESRRRMRALGRLCSSRPEARRSRRRVAAAARVDRAWAVVVLRDPLVRTAAAVLRQRGALDRSVLRVAHERATALRRRDARRVGRHLRRRDERARVACAQRRDRSAHVAALVRADSGRGPRAV